MTDFEIAIDDAIAKWYHDNQDEGNYLAHLFDNRRWVELFDEQKQIAAQLFLEEMVS
jgi:hypothetical protein